LGSRGRLRLCEGRLGREGVVLLLGMALTAIVAGWPAGALAADLTVFAAASLTNAFQEIGPAFERAHPATRARFNFAASSLLRTQIEQGAACDVFASADREQMEPLARARRVGAVTLFAQNRLVVVMPAANPGRIQRLQDLARTGLRLVITAEQVPIGRYTRQALGKMDGPQAMGQGFRSRVLANVVSQEANARALLTKVTLGEADAAIVYASDAVAAGGKVSRLAIPARYNEIADYPAAPVVGSRLPKEAAEFVRFLRSRAAQQILQRHGFELP
jgi:molybdate transport system substrate-binding protein